MMKKKEASAVRTLAPNGSYANPTMNPLDVDKSSLGGLEIEVGGLSLINSKPRCMSHEGVQEP